MILHRGLDAEGAKWLLENVRKPMVRIDPRGMKSTFMGPGWGRAQLLAVNERRGTAIVQPAGHKQTEEIELRYIRKWNSKNELQMPLTAAIGELVKQDPIKQIVKKAAEAIKQETPAKDDWRVGQTKWSREQMEEAKKLREMGKSHEEISAVTGIPRGTVGAILIRMGIPVRSYNNKKEIAKPTPIPAILSYKDVAPSVKPTIDTPKSKPIVGSPAPASVVAAKGKERILADAIQAILKTNMNDVAKLLAIDALTQP